MRAEDFISAVYTAVYKTTIDGIIGILARPPGRRPRPMLSELSNWHNGLDESERNYVKEIVRLSVDHAVFGMLAALDGARTLGQDSEFMLQADGENLTESHDLHDLFRNYVDQELG